MSETKDGGPAFPQSLAPEGPFGGMSIRDWYAGQVMAGMYAGGVVAGGFASPTGREANARLAYLQADAMLAERERTR